MDPSNPIMHTLALNMANTARSRVTTCTNNKLKVLEFVVILPYVLSLEKVPSDMHQWGEEGSGGCSRGKVDTCVRKRWGELLVHNY